MSILGKVKNKLSNMLKSKFILGILFLFIILSSIVWDIFVKEIDAGYFGITQHRITGDLNARVNPGKFWGPLLKVHKYRISDTFWFSKFDFEGGRSDQSVLVRYVDGGTAKISGNVRWELPSNPESLVQLHLRYRSQTNFTKSTLREVVNEAVNISAQLMSSTESYTTKKAEYMERIQDQVNEGVYILEAITVSDSISEGQTKRKNIIKTNPDGSFVRKPNPLKEYNVKLSLLVVHEADYEEGILNQIRNRRTRLMQRVISQSEANLAVQENLTLVAQGEAQLVRRQFSQEVINITEIVGAEKNAEVQQIQADARRQVAEIQRKISEIKGRTELLHGDGESYVKKRLQAADSNLEIRLQAYEEGHRIRALAFGTGKRPVSAIMMSSAAGGGNIMELLGIDAAKKLLESIEKKPGGNK